VHQIRNGQTIIAYLPANARSLKSAMSHPAKESKVSDTSAPYNQQNIVTIESAKQADRDFNNWECNRDCPLVLAGVLRMMENDDDEYYDQFFSPPTVVVSSTTISESPLPELITLDRFWVDSADSFLDLRSSHRQLVSPL
jgi:hypothetical protein